MSPPDAELTGEEFFGMMDLNKIKEVFLCTMRKKLQNASKSAVASKE